MRISRTRYALLAAVALLAGCAGTVAPQPTPIPPKVARAALPPMASFGAPRPTPSQRSNTAIARDILE